MKWIKRIVVLVVLLILLAGVIIYLSLNSIVRGVIERQATASLGVPTTLGSAQLSLFGGRFSLSDLEISSPPKFTSPHIFTLDGTALDVQYSQLTSTPIHIQKITIDHPVVVVEQAGLKLNLDALMDQMPTTPKTSGGSDTTPVKLVIDELDLNNAEVTFMAGIPQVPDSFQVPISSMTLKNIGNADGNENGAAIKDVVMQTVVALTVKGVDDSKLSPEVKLLISQDLSLLAGKLGPGFNNQYQDLAGPLVKQLPKNIQGTVNQILGGLQKATGH